MTQYAFYFDSTRCTGCRTCEMACKDYKDSSEGIHFRKVYDYEGGTCELDANGICTSSAFVYHVSLGCQHCDDPACVQVCPTGAMHKDADTGIVSVDAGKCIGCGYCHMACPYNVPTVDRTLGHSVKCDGCAERVAEGKNPICVDACPLRALEFGPVEEVSGMGEVADIAPLPPAHYTSPNLYIKATPDAQPADAREGIVANPVEVM